jgi:hypothetical protein
MVAISYHEQWNHPRSEVEADIAIDPGVSRFSDQVDMGQ